MNWVWIRINWWMVRIFRVSSSNNSIQIIYRWSQPSRMPLQITIRSIYWTHQRRTSECYLAMFKLSQQKLDHSSLKTPLKSSQQELQQANQKKGRIELPSNPTLCNRKYHKHTYKANSSIWIQLSSLWKILLHSTVAASTLTIRKERTS